MNRKSIMIDCDPGHDDAIGIILACASDILDVKGITTVGGNQTIAKTTNNALRVLNFIGKKIPVAMGADTPMRRPIIIAPSVHGDSGLDGPAIEQSPQKPLDISAVQLMAETIERSEEKITLVATGPLTNIAVFLLAYPRLKNRIERISLMGGSAIGGNWTPAAEFNILVDPEAADIVFQSGIPITMAGLDVTHKARVYPEDIKRIKDQGGKVAILVGELLEFFIKFHNEQGWDFAPLHDPCAIAWLLKPEIFESRKLNVVIDIHGEYTTGCTVTDFTGISGRTPNTDVLLNVDRHQFIDLIIDAVNKYQ
jgi:pyrimidine-specific ribonucleoside hydrolase